MFPNLCCSMCVFQPSCAVVGERGGGGVRCPIPMRVSSIPVREAPDGMCDPSDWVSRPAIQDVPCAAAETMPAPAVEVAGQPTQDVTPRVTVEAIPGTSGGAVVPPSNRDSTDGLLTKGAVEAALGALDTGRMFTPLAPASEITQADREVARILNSLSKGETTLETCEVPPLNLPEVPLIDGKTEVPILNVHVNEMTVKVNADCMHWDSLDSSLEPEASTPKDVDILEVD